MKARRVLGERCLLGNRLIARKYAASEEALAGGVGRELVVAVQITVPNALLEPIDDVRRLAEFDDATHLDAGTEPELNARDNAEQSVAADRQAEGDPRSQRASKSAARRRRQGGRRLRPAARSASGSVHVRAHCTRGRRRGSVDRLRSASERSPLPVAPFLYPVQVVQQLRPLNPRLDADVSALGVEAQERD